MENGIYGVGDERRAIPVRDAELRVKDGGRRLVGYAAVFDVESEDLGGFREVIRPGAFTEALRGSDARALFNHDPDHILGREGAGTLTLREDSHGLRYEIDLPDTETARTVVTSIERGDVDGSSFSFVVAEDGDEMIQRRDGMLRIIEAGGVEEVLDVGPVTFPAYEATAVSARALRRAKRLTGSGGSVAAKRRELERARRKALPGGDGDLAGRRRRLEDLRRELEGTSRRRTTRTPRRRPMGRMRVAYHEAGHCVGFYAGLVGIARVKVRGDGSGYVERREGDDQRRTTRALLAGIAASEIRGHDLPTRGTKQDRERARKWIEERHELHPLASSHDRRKRDRLIRKAKQDARQLLERQRPAWTALAERLHEKGELRGDEAEDILRRHWRGGQPRPPEKRGRHHDRTLQLIA